MRARLVELDERNVALARRAAQAAGLHGVEVLQADAGITDACAGAVPAQIVVACGSDASGRQAPLRIAEPCGQRNGPFSRSF